VTVAAPQDLAVDEEVEAFNDHLPFRVHRLRRWGMGPMKLFHRLAVVSALLRRDRPTVILASGERMVWLAATLHRLHQIPFIAVGHAMEFNVHPRWQFVLTRHAFQAAIGAICVSKYTWSRMETCGIRARAGAVIPNGADDTRFRPLPESERVAFRRAHGLERATILITVGSVHERKGQDVVIRALPRVLERIPDVHYVIVGVPYRREAFEQLAQQLGVADRVHFLGMLDSAGVVRALNAADLFVMASQHTAEGDFEGFGIAVLEAALCGRAAVVSDNSGVIEAIEPGETGLAATIADPSSTADRIVELLSDRQMLASMGRRARDRAVIEKTWVQRGAQYDELMRRLVEPATMRAPWPGVNDVTPDVH